MENERFCFRRPFSRGITPLKFETFRSENRSVSPQNPSSLSLRGGRVRPTRQSLTKQIGIPKRNMENRNETGRNNMRRHNSPRVSYYVDHFSLSVPVLHHGMPCLWLKDCRVAAFLTMTRKWQVFRENLPFLFPKCSRFVVERHRHSVPPGRCIMRPRKDNAEGWIVLFNISFIGLPTHVSVMQAS